MIHQPLVEMDVGILHGTHWKGHTEGCTQAKRSSMCLKDGHHQETLTLLWLFFGCLWESLGVFAKDWLHVWA